MATSVSEGTLAACAVASLALVGYGLREYLHICRERQALILASTIAREVRETLLALRHRSYGTYGRVDDGR